MINESQAEFLLTECEEWLGTKLCELRKRIRNDHKTTKAHLWELVVLYAAASSAVSGYVKQGELTSDISHLIEHEPGEANPDVLLRPNNCEPFFIEVAYVMLQDKEQEAKIPKYAKDNPIYKAIEKKAEQAKKWKKNGKTFQPLVLCIGASENLHQINAINPFSFPQLEKAVYSALLDIEQCDLATRLNFTDNRALPWSMREKDDLRVSGSGLISSVIIVTIRNEPDVFGLTRKARSLIINNPHSDVELTAAQKQFLNQINFNQVEYGSRQSWENPINQSVSITLDRYREARGRFTLETYPSIAFALKIPAHLVVRILAGDITAHEVWEDNEFGAYLKCAASINQQIIDVNFVQVNPKSRDEAQIKLEFGETVNPKNFVDDSYFRESIEFSANGDFVLKLPVNLVLHLLAGKVTANEAWTDDNQKKIVDSLKDAMNKGQKIIDAKLVQIDSESKNKLHIILKFGVASENIIRGKKSKNKKPIIQKGQLNSLF